jgi:hypothetical protein
MATAAARLNAATPDNQPTDEPTLALSVRQPWAELILRGIQRFEQRSRPTRIRGRILVYASLGRYSRDVEADIAEECGIELDESCWRGFIVGSVELFDCRRGEAGEGWQWWLRRPERAKKLRKPTRHPMPVWFRPW